MRLLPILLGRTICSSPEEASSDISADIAELLFDIAGRAYEHQNLIVTPNLPFEEWTEIFVSERLTGALLDRLTLRCHILEANGESYRLRQAKALTVKPI